MTATKTAAPTTTTGGAMTRTEYAALLRNLTIGMTTRYGLSCQGEAFASGGRVFNGKTDDQWSRARARQFKAIQRLTLAQLRLTEAQ